MEPAINPIVVPQGTKPTILFVDDEERILRSLRMMFALDYKVLTTTDGHEALEILKRENIHVLVSDQRMPVMLGVDLLRQAREISPNTMRLLLTGYSDMEAVIGSINDGEIFRYISKPWCQEEMRETIRQAAEIALSLPELPQPIIVEHPHGEDLILLIDEDPEVASGIKALIDEHMPGKYHVEWASDLETALAILERGRVALAISEIRLGGEDITPFISVLKQHNPFLITIVLTSFQDSGHLIRLINQGQIFRFLPKPLRRTMLFRGVVSGLDRHHAMRRAPQLARRHAVETPAKGHESPIARRVSNFFRSLNWARAN